MVFLLATAYLWVTFEDPMKDHLHFGDKHLHLIEPGSKDRVDDTELIEPIPPLSLTVEQMPAIQLGKQLFMDPNLSSNQQVSCESCHHIYSDGAEESKVSVGVNGAGARNSPTVFNVAYNTRFFWDGRAASLSEQIDGPLHNPLEMNTNWQDVLLYVNSVESYRDQFQSAFDGQMTKETVKAALVAFMRALDTPNAPFDQYLRGDENALNPAAKVGWQKFKSLGCVVCHQGQNIGGNLFQRFGHLDNTYAQSDQDLGRYNVTGQEQDRRVFRVASLRNVAETAPYFHDGRAETLEEAIMIMAQVQLGYELEADSIIEISAFLRALSAPPPPVLKELAQ